MLVKNMALAFFVLILPWGYVAAAEPTGDAAEGYSLRWNEIRVIDISEVNKAQCKFLKLDTCNSSKGYGYCNRWLQKRAVREKSDTIAILSKEKEFSTFSFTGTAATVQAEFYYCGDIADVETISNVHKYDELRKLNGLYVDGILSEEEYEAEKQKILARD